MCPNCGAPVEFASAASASAVCGFCRSTLLREGDALRKIGVSAELIEDYSPLQLGAAGRFAGAPFSVVGRLQYGYADGSWNEWHLLFDPGPGGARSGWLSEDNGSFVIAFDAALTESAPQEQALRLGERLTLAGQSWSVAALTQATLAAAQGELPRPPALDKTFLVAELRNTQNEVGTLEYSEAASPQWSVGRPVRIVDLAMTGLRDADAGSKALGSRSLPCPNCGASLEPRLASTQSLTCPQCRAVVDISKGVGAELTHYVQANGGEPQIPLGTTGALNFPDPQAPTPWQVVGYQERCDMPSGPEDEQTFWREYLLFNKTEGFVFLVDTEEGWSLVRPLTGAPVQSGNSIEWQGVRYHPKYGGAYPAKTTYVLGEFYWRVQRDEHALVTDYDALGGKELLSREQTGQEVNWSQGRKLDAAEVARAFRLPPEKHAALARDASGLTDSGHLLRKIVFALFILLVIVLLVRACSSDDCAAYARSFGTNSPEYAQCKRTGGGRIAPVGGYGGSYGGFGSGGGGHK